MPGKKGKQRKVVQDDDSAPADEEPAATSSTRRSTRLLEKKPEGSKDTVEQVSILYARLKCTLNHESPDVLL